jgi:hypothetical protein
VGPETLEGAAVSTIIFLTALVAGAESTDLPTVVIAVGAPGAPEYQEPFQEWAERWQQAAEQAGARVVRIGQEPLEAASDRDRLVGLLQDEPKQGTSPLWLILIGHGTFDGRNAKFNLRGTDVTAGELSEWLDGYERPVVVINCASSSAPFINELSGPNRILITATKSGFELNYARFGEHLSAAMLDPSADLDKDQQTSLLEAFLIASRRTAEFYETEGRLVTETALVDDNGDGRGTPANWYKGTRVSRQGKDGANADGTRAGQLHLIRSEQEILLSPEQRRRRDELEQAIATLRDSKTESTNKDEYYAKLEPLMVELARLYQSAEQSDAPPEDSSK